LTELPPVPPAGTASRAFSEPSANKNIIALRHGNYPNV